MTIMILTNRRINLSTIIDILTIKNLLAQCSIQQQQQQQVCLARLLHGHITQNCVRSAYEIFKIY